MLRPRSSEKATSPCTRDSKKRQETVKTASTPLAVAAPIEPELVRLLTAFESSTPPLFLPRYPPDGRGGGLGKFRVNSDHMLALTDLHDRISDAVDHGVTWGEGEGHDPRRRMYGFLPGKLEELIDAGIRIHRLPGITEVGGEEEGSESGDHKAEQEEHREAISAASVELSFEGRLLKERALSSPKAIAVPQSAYIALAAVTEFIRSILPDRYKPYVSMENLIAAQPNHHNGAHFLPAHLDFPRNDGFGVVIATVAIRFADSTVVLIDDGNDGEDSASWTFDLTDNDCYVLCGPVRNLCVHGVVSKAVAESNGVSRGGKCCRETLNLRYGLHSKRFAEEEIDRYWPD